MLIYHAICLKIPFIETSAYSAHNVDNVFIDMTKDIIEALSKTSYNDFKPRPVPTIKPGHSLEEAEDKVLGST